MTPEDEAGRQIGKTCDLAFGYGGGLKAYRRFDASGAHNDAQVNTFKNEWRAQHAATVRFWRLLENMLHRALRSKQRIVWNNLAADYGDDSLYLILPSGRRLAYPRAHLVPGDFAPQIVFKDNARGAWSDIRGWHGTFTENVVQAVARDLLAAAMARLEAHGYPVVFHVHDEIVCEVPIDAGDTKRFLELMSQLPAWATNLPIVAKAWSGARYAKSQPTPQMSALIPARVSAPIPKPIPTPAPKLNGHAIIKVDDGKITCPFHDDNTPSMQVYDDHVHCFGCGVHLDLIDFVMMVEGINRAEALNTLAGWKGLTAKPRIEDDDENKRKLNCALRIWNAAKPIANTLAIKYLADVRGVDTDVLPTDNAALRFHPACPFGQDKVACLVALYRDVETDAFAGIHRIALTDDVFARGKAQRLTLGRWSTPRAIKIWPAADRLFLGEGVETVLAAATRLKYRGASMHPAWAAGNADNLTEFPVLANTKQIVVLVDHDQKGKQSAHACWRRWRQAGRQAVRLLPKREGADFNDVVRERIS